ncbi:FxsB family cyclophane-forming radical SAM/SPASM peptide maturase [Streptomyces sp. V4-01]|uniref:FxsB family cyclophane-forming radical SAM/SPASM peptide maturase n=1 Tax=Actinacidiphila polyblastidii TaxID=3110430 RepID=A0ABU7PB89_9ACTN|nr:FxsB family cyclophane-forming radical SAM/SPASM peptide maturase [Streptomyces sp. V4-01]
MTRSAAGGAGASGAAQAPAAPSSYGLRQFVLKIHGRCNLACDYCYVYEAADQSWRTKPAAMSPRVVAQAAARIGSYVRRTRPPWVEVVLHGGEPLLAGIDTIARAVTGVRDEVGDSTTVRFVLQTNGVLLTGPVLDELDRLGVMVAVSIDGEAADNDRHRVFRDGRGSHEAAAAGLRRLTSPAYRHLFVGLLCVVDLAADPLRTLAALESWRPPTVDFLLPHRTWADPPPQDARFGAWLATVFDAWFPRNPRDMSIRVFDEIIAVALGARTGTASIGAGPVEYVTVETDGTIESDDTMKVAFPGAPRTGLDIAVNDFADFLASPGIRARRPGVAGLCSQCRSCAVVDVCGGGAYAHRHRPGFGFANPSAYCADLFHLISHIRNTILDELAY